MKKFSLCLLLLFAFSNGLADEVVTLKSGKKIVIKDNGTWSYVVTSSNDENSVYREISLLDLQLDIDSLEGEKIMSQGIAQFALNMLMLKREMMDMNPLLIDVKNISRDEMKFILTNCTTGCRITVYGQVGDVRYQKGIIADKIEWD